MIERIEEIIVVAGKELLIPFEEGTGAREKTSSTDFVTEADLRVYRFLKDSLSEAFRGERIVSEEDSAEDIARLENPDFTGFVIDPIDGTYNFKRGMRESAVSVGLISKGEPVAGAIYDPFKEELFSAELGKGARLNGETIQVSDAKGIDGSHIVTSNDYGRELLTENLDNHKRILFGTQGVPWLGWGGSAALVLAWIACGRVDLYHHLALKPWDTAAGFLLCREAGAVLTNHRGEDIRFTDSQVVVGTPGVVEETLRVFSS